MISINVADLSQEKPEALRALGVYLLNVAGGNAGMVAPASAPLETIASLGASAPAPVAAAIIPPPPAEQIDTSTGEITQHGSSALDADAQKLTDVFGAGAAGATLADIAPPPTTAPSGTVLDANGLPWDSRIHSSSKELLRGGAWRARRNTDKALIATVEAELRQVLGAPAPVVEPVVGIVPPPPAAPGIVPPPPPADAAPAAVNPFPAFMEWVVGLTTSGKIEHTKVTEYTKEEGLPHVGALHTRPDLIPAVRAKIEAYLAAQGAA